MGKLVLIIAPFDFLSRKKINRQMQDFEYIKSRKKQ